MECKETINVLKMYFKYDEFEPFTLLIKISTPQVPCDFWSGQYDESISKDFLMIVE